MKNVLKESSENSTKELKKDYILEDFSLCKVFCAFFQCWKSSDFEKGKDVKFDMTEWLGQITDQKIYWEDVTSDSQQPELW